MTKDKFFTLSEITQLRSQFAKIDRVDPCLPSYSKITDLLDGCEIETLRQVAASNIKFVSILARNRVFRAMGAF